jgi:hypothetical protein
MADPVPYKEAFPAGSRVRIAVGPLLNDFMKSWKYHHKLSPEQLDYADRETMVSEVGFYHGGDPVYKLVGIPGFWLEQCLKSAEGRRGAEEGAEEGRRGTA